MTDLLTKSVDRMYPYRTVVLVLAQLVMSTASNQAAFWLRFDGAVPPEQQPHNVSLLPLLVLVRLAVFYPLRLHRGVWRYSSIWDLRNIVIGVIGSSFIFWFVTHGVLGVLTYPRSVFIIDAILLILLMGGVRLWRRLHAASSRHRKARPVLIYGAGDAGEMIVRDMLQNAAYGGTPIGFVDDDPNKVGQRIHGVPVLGSRDQLAEILHNYRPEELLLAIPSASPKVLQRIVRTLEPFKIRITTVPKPREVSGEIIDVDQVRQLRVEDLLAREPVGLDPQAVQGFLQNKRILVTGAGGSIGAELCRQIAAARPACLILLDRYENGLFQISHELAAQASGVPLLEAIADITDGKRIEQVFNTMAPQVVFHAAAHKHVPLMEANPCEAVKNNVMGTRVLAEASLRSGVEKFLLISTDKAVNPTSVMGATKRVAEMITHRLHETHGTKFAAVRFGNVLASNGSVVPTFLAQITKGGPVTITHPEMRRYFMLIPEAVQLVLHAAALDDAAPLFVLDMGEQLKVVDLARDLIRLAGLVPDKDIEIRFTSVRPGEKLYEELIGPDEVAERSSQPKIMKVRFRVSASADLPETVQRLESLAMDGRAEDVLKLLLSTVSSEAVSKSAVV
jgi:FlaA1/EpsC-like NDP-sugar epimerase